MPRPPGCGNGCAGPRAKWLAAKRSAILGADSVLRDPLRLGLLLAYLARYQRDPPLPAPPVPVDLMSFAGGILRPEERKLACGPRSTSLTPREVELVEYLVSAEGEVVSYETLYDKILHRSFGGDTSNMRVLLGSLAASAARIGLTVRSWVEVIPKSGYRYRADGPTAMAHDSPCPPAADATPGFDPVAGRAMHREARG